MGLKSTLAVLIAMAALSVSVSAQTASMEALTARARAIHDRVITIDTHDDIAPANFTADCNYTMRLATQVTLPKMKEGGLDVAFFVVYVGQGPLTDAGYADAYRQAIEKFDAVHRLTEQIAPREIELALTAADVTRIARSGKTVAVIGIENGYPIGSDLGRVKEFWERGGRYMSLAHNGHSQLSDSNTGDATNDFPQGGLSPLGRLVIAEMNRLGIMVDVSHPSKASMLQAAALSKAPIIASHSSVRTLANHSRNLDDEQLLALKKNGGVVQMVAFANYLKTEPPERVRERQAALTLLQTEYGVTPPGPGRATGPATARPPCPIENPRGEAAGVEARAGGANQTALAALSPERRAEYDRRLAELRTKYREPARATVTDFVDHIDYAVKLMGIDHVGISSDFDGGGGIEGWNSAAETFNVTLELVRRGYTEGQIGKLWSGNVLRVWSEVEKVARRLQGK